MSTESHDVAEPLLIKEARRMSHTHPHRHIRITSGGGTTIGGLVRELDEWRDALIKHAHAEAWPCANYQAPATCLTAPSSESGRCDWCKGVGDQIRAQERERIALVADDHEPMEAQGGYIECTCPWPSREQWESGEHFIVHLLREAAE